MQSDSATFPPSNVSPKPSRPGGCLVLQQSLRYVLVTWPENWIFFPIRNVADARAESDWPPSHPPHTRSAATVSQKSRAHILGHVSSRWWDNGHLWSAPKGRLSWSTDPIPTGILQIPSRSKTIKSSPVYFEGQWKCRTNMGRVLFLRAAAWWQTCRAWPS